jgi:primosomal protein N' (replication factor Y)
MPAVEILDMRAAEFTDESQIFSIQLAEALRANVEREEQSILLMNRRGFASFVMCRGCGERLACTSCSVSFTWHRARKRLVCHYCDHVLPLPERCPSCDDDALTEVGSGTERVVDRLEELVPEARVARMDRDTTRGHKLTALLTAFRNREIDILVGTQMVAKGHDFPGVTLVGVLLAEMGLGLPDFRAAERTFALITQMAGRAGRAERPGRVLVQTFMPEHPMLAFAKGHDAEGFLTEELLSRQARGFPPCRHLALFRVSGADDNGTWEAADRLRHQLHALATALPEGPTRPEVLGPHPAPIERLRDRWRYQVLVNGADRVLLGRLLERGLATIEATKQPSHIRIDLDVDPYAFL